MKKAIALLSSGQRESVRVSRIWRDYPYARPVRVRRSGKGYGRITLVLDEHKQAPYLLHVSEAQTRARK